MIDAFVKGKTLVAAFLVLGKLNEFDGARPEALCKKFDRRQQA